MNASSRGPGAGSGRFASIRRSGTSGIQGLGREFLWVMLGQSAGALGGLVGVRLMTHALDPRQYGTLALGMTAATLANQAVLGPLSEGSLRFYSVAVESGELNGYLGAVKRLAAAAIGVVVLAAVFVASGLTIAGQVRSLPLLAGAVALAILAGTAAILAGIQNAARHRVTVAWHDGLSQWLRYLTACALMFWFSATAAVAIVGYAMGAALVLVSQSYLFVKFILRGTKAATISADDDVKWQYRHAIARYAWPFATWGMFTWAQLVSDRWALELYRGTREVGRYAALYQLGYYPVTLLGSAATQLAVPILFARAGDASSADRVATATGLSRHIMLLLGILTAAGTAAASLFHRQIFRLLVGPEYRSVSHWLPVVVLSAGLFAIGQAATTGVLARQRTRDLIAPKIGTSALALVMSFAGAAFFGLPGVVLAGLIFGVTYLAWMLRVLAR